MLLKQLAGRQLSIKGEKSHSWYISIKDILLKHIKYNLPLPLELLDLPPTSFESLLEKDKLKSLWTAIGPV